jgi:hypothetical protein
MRCRIFVEGCLDICSNDAAQVAEGLKHVRVQECFSILTVCFRFLLVLLTILCHMDQPCLGRSRFFVRLRIASGIGVIVQFPALVVVF